MKSRKIYKYDICLLIIWTVAFILGIFSNSSAIYFNYTFMYLALICELIKEIIQHKYFYKIEKMLEEEEKAEKERLKVEGQEENNND